MTDPRKWLEFARDDLTLAVLALQNGIYNQVCFHSQRGVEKALKGFLRSCQRSVPRTHALREGLTLCQTLDESFHTLKDTCVRLDRYYIPTRYPDALPGTAPEGLPARQDAEEAVAMLQEVLQWIKGKVT